MGHRKRDRDLEDEAECLLNGCNNPDQREEKRDQYPVDFGLKREGTELGRFQEQGIYKSVIPLDLWVRCPCCRKDGTDHL